MDRNLSTVFDADHDDLVEHFERATYRGREYFYLPDERHGVERGTVVAGCAVVRGFPSIPRVLVLEPGVPDFFDGPVTVEEKLNGYNVRIARVDGDVLAFTRSGYVCPFTTSLAADYPLDSFFDEYPDTVVCGELIGPENPYTTHDYAEVDEAALRVFDLRDRESGEPMAVERRRERCDAYDLSTVPAFGTHEPDAAVDAIREAIADLDEQGREGVVVKSEDGERALKYTTSAIHRADLAHAFDKPFDYGQQFMFARVIREAFQSVEFGEDEATARERAREMGESVLLPAIESIRAVEDGSTIGDTHTVRGDPATIESLLNRFRAVGLHLDIEEDTYEDDERVVRFTKVADASRDKINHLLSGGTIDE
ncbi:RNA ligase [Salinibaculum rarum]|uniref:RNA ligase n=1 Tax=Salinibaculum rarum TaxID=3058903 RepID=UPI00265E3FF0|nr:RNA ligase [Salinibaculum sp. KK48]